MIPYSERLKSLRSEPTPGSGAADLVTRLLAETLGIGAAELRPDARFAELGLSSLLGVRFLDRVNRALGLRLGVASLFEHASPAEFAAFVARAAPQGCPLPVQTQRSTAADGIAVIGISGRFAGAPDVDSFWRHLQAGDCIVTEAPPERWDAARFYDPTPGKAGKTVSKWAGFLPDIDKFDAAFFAISPTEAVAIDPQQRLFLEEAWHAFENAGYPADRLKGRAVGVYVGAAPAGYEQVLQAAGRDGDPYAMTGNLTSMLAARIAYLLDLAGPALTVDTACSSSLVALDLAVQALDRGDIEMALVGGVSLFFDEKPFLAMSRVGMLAPDGRCKPFDDSADGIAVGEAVAAILLKPLARALADGDRIDAVIRASGTNQDGKSNGITAPNPRAQADLLRRVYEGARIDPATIGMVEAHGTGTRLGDPIEVAALREAYGAGDGASCALGSVKSNIGHTSHAAGLAGLIKAILCLRERRQVPSANFTRLNDRIELTGSRFFVSRQTREWPAPPDGRRRRAAVSAFGLSGTNAHVVVEEAPVAGEPEPAQGPQLIVLSAHSEAALDRRCRDLAAWLRAQTTPPRLADVAWTLLAGRTALPYRLAFVVDSLDALSATLDRIAAGGLVPEILRDVGRIPSSEAVPDAARWSPAAVAGAAGDRRAVLTQLAQSFVAGCRFDLADLHVGCSRALPLPGYPFERVSHWPKPRQAAIPEPRATGPHPFLEAELPAGGGFAKTFSPADPVVRDHVVAGTPILHAAVFLEMARAAATRASGRPIGSLQAVAWRQTLEVLADGRRIELRLTPVEGGYSCGLFAAETPRAIAECRALFNAAAAGSFDPEAIQAQADQVIDRADLANADNGVVRLGPSFRGFDRLWLAADEALAWLNGPFDADCPLAPRAIDAAIQTAVLLVARSEGAEMRLRYPAALERLEIAMPLPAEGCFVRARRAAPPEANADILDIDIADRNGTVCLRLAGLRLQTVGAAEARPAEEPTTRTCRAVWRARPTTGLDPARPRVAAVFTPNPDAILPARVADRVGAPIVRLDDTAAVEAVVAGLDPGARLYVVIPAGSADSAEDVAARIEPEIIALLRFMQALAARDLGGAPLELRIVTDRACPVTGHETQLDPLGAALHGLGKAAAREFPAWRVRLLDVDQTEIAGAPEPALDWLIAEPGAATGEPVAWRNGQRWEKLLEPAPLPPEGSIRPGAAILVVGGLGRVGRTVCRHLCTVFGARLVILGRAPPNAEKEAFLGELRQAGGAAVYVQGDVTDPASVAAAVAAAQREYGALNGVIQAAIDPVFGRIAQADLGEFRNALRPKLLGPPALHSATAGLDLDLFAIFSSIGAFHGFPGNIAQSSYCVGCCFEEAYAGRLRALAERPATVIDWGLWGHDDYRPDLLAEVVAQGTYVLPPLDAAALFPRLLDAAGGHVVHARLAPAVWQALGDPTMAGPAPDNHFTAAATALVGARDRAEIASDPALAEYMDAYIRARLADWLRSEGFLDRGDPRTKLRALPKYAGLVEAILAIVESAPAANLDAAAARRILLEAAPEAAAALALLDPCLDALPAVLAGETLATDVLFPGGSMARVEPLYRGQPALEYCNRLVAAAVVALAERAGRPVTIVEIGAGTGATSAAVFAALAERGIAVHYRYTDISAGFVRHGKAQYEGPGRDFAVLDIEGDPEIQGFAAGEADIVIAANVLHATRRIANTLGNLGKLLRPGGVLLASELTRPDNFGTVTFGLLDGWWLSEDREVRLPHGPILDAPRWEWQLRKAGFDRVREVSLPGLDDPGSFPHSVILAARPETPARTPASRAPAAAPSAKPAARSDSLTDRMPALIAQVRAEIAAALGLAEADIDPETPYADIGVDSIIAPQIAENINQRLGIALRSTDLYNYPTVQRLADHIREKFPDLRPEASAEPEATEPSPRAAVAQASERSHQYNNVIPAKAGIHGSAAEAPDKWVPALAGTTGWRSPAIPDTISVSNAVAADERIAVIGLAGRFPGAPDVGAYWDNLAAGRSAIREIDRFDMAPYFAPERGIPGKAYAKWAGLLPDHDRFDPLFFNITPAEAEVMDPQQRVLLEEAWHALEHAGYPPERLSNSRCGVFVGASANNYTAPAAPSLQTLGQSMAILSARVAYFLNLRGPAFPVDTGCSSSLVSTHLACRSLLAGDCDIALAAGVSVNLISPEIFLYLCDAGMASPEGRCKTFDDDADGFAPGEGVGVLVLKRLADAQRDGDRIDAVILGSGVNQDGKTSGMTAPSAASQTALEIEVYRRSRIDPATIGLVEAHGTGTRLGDPIEIAALTDAFAEFTDRRGFCAIGSVKTNIGHAMAAAGVAGLIKAILAFKHRQIPASLNFSSPNRHIDFAASPFRVATATEDWAASGSRRAAVSSFGFSGTNGHIVLEEAPAAPIATAPSGPVLVLLSAKTEAALERRVAGLTAWLRSPAAAEVALFDIAHTLAVRRSHFRHRRAVVTDSIEHLSAALAAPAPASGIGGDAVPAIAAVGAAYATGKAPRREDLEQVASAYRAGAEIDTAALFGQIAGPPIVLPLYPFERERYWNMAAPSCPLQAAPPVASLHPLLERNLSNRHGFRFATTLRPEMPWLADHKIGGRAVLPGAAILEMARAAVAYVADAPIGALSDVIWSAPVEVADAAVEVEVAITAAGDGYACRLTGSGGATLHASLTARIEPPEPGRAADLTALTARFPERRDGGSVYPALAASGVDYGPLFRVVSWFGIGEGEAIAELQLPEGADAAGLVLHPALLDGALQAAAGIGLGGAASDGLARVPFGLGRLEIFAALPARCLAHARLRSAPGDRVLKFDIDIMDMSGCAVARLRELAARPLAAPRAAPAEATLLYRPDWRPQPIPVDASPAGGAMVLFGADLVQQFDALATGVRLLRVETGGRFAALGSDRFAIDPSAAADYAQLWQAAAGAGDLTLALVWPWGDPPLDRDGRQTAATTRDKLRLETGLHALFHLTQAAALAGSNRPRTSILYVGRSDGGRPQTDAAAAFLRSTMAEHPDLNCRVIELDAPPTLELLAAESGRRTTTEPIVRYAGGVRLVRHLTAVEAAPAAAPVLRAGGTCVVSGGAGALARLVAGHLMETRDARIVLLGRSEPTPELEAEILKLEQRGGEVLYLAADMTDAAAMRSALDRARRQFGPINGVVHTAGRLRDGFLRNKSAEDFAAVLMPKLLGAIHLDHLTRDDPLDFFALFSSTAAELGVVGQSDYAAANGFLDGFAEHRAALVARGVRQGTTLSVAWPLWAEGGMAPDPEGRARLAAAGLLPMPSAAGLEVLDAGLRLDLPRLVALHGDPDKLPALISGNTADLPPRTAPAAATSEPELAAAVEAYLKRILAEVAKLRPEQIDPAQSFEAYGIDSMMVMRLNAAIERDFPELPKTLFFEYQTVAELTGYFLAKHAARAAEVLIPSSPAAAMAPTAAAEPLPRPAPAPSAGSQDIAIIGVSGLYPGAPDLETFWENLRSGRDCITEIPPKRWPLDGFYDPDRDNPRTSYSKWGGFIEDADKFDARFFNIAPNEAETIDPQARKFLETAWATLEDAGYTRDTLFAGEPDPARRKAGVFVGVMYGDYQLYGPEELAKGNLIGPNAAYWNLANRVSYFMNFHGPSLAVDTACSSSLTAIHLACQSLGAGDCSVALAGGVNLSLHPSKYWILSRAGFAASDGRCRSFGAGGDGYVPGEGIGCVLLKPLDRAVADGDRIYGVIKGSSVNHGGKTTGYTVPNPNAQGALIAEALGRAGTPPETISYIEAHGTGTELGDPVEIAGLLRAFGELPPESCAIGSVKSNIGHLESAAGIAGLTKVLLQFAHDALAPSLHAETPNPNLDFARTPFRLQRSLAAWPRQEGAPRRAGVSSFGAGGANAHVIVEEPPALPMRAAPERRAHVVPLSAATAEALQESACRLSDYLRRHPDLALADVTHTVQRGREAMRHRLAVVADSVLALVAALDGFAVGAPSAACFTGVVRPGPAARDDAVTGDGSLTVRAAAWVMGAGVDWARFAEPSARRIALPTYPFAKRRCWVKLTPPAGIAEERAPLHPLIDRVDLDFAGPLFRNTFPAESGIAADHRIGGEAVVPGAALLETARAAAAHMPGFGHARAVTDIAWRRPVPGGAAVTVRLARDGDAAAFEIVTGSAPEMLHARGRVLAETPAPAAAQLDIDAVSARCPRAIEAPQIYALLETAGVSYGPSLRLLQSARVGDGEAVARLAELPNTPPSIVFPPALLDAAFQLSFALVPENGAGCGFLPVAIRQIAAYADLSATRAVHARRRQADADRIDLDFALLDSDGRVLAAIDGFAAQAIGRSPSESKADTPPLLTLRPVWVELPEPPEPAEPHGPILILTTPDGLGIAQAVETATGGATVRTVVLDAGWMPEDAASFGVGGMPPEAVFFIASFAAMPDGAAAQATLPENATRALFRVLKALGKQDNPPQLTLITAKAQQVFPGEAFVPLAAGLIGLLKAAAHENPGWTIRLLDLDPGERLPAEILNAALPHPADLELAVRGGRLYARRLERMLLPDTAAAPWKTGGTYLIAGGAGGIGLALARHLAENFGARIALLGRSPLDEAKRREINQIAEAGGEAAYFQADLADLASLRQAVAEVRTRFGRIDGVVHSAMVMHDATLARLDEDRLMAVLAPKLRGLANLAEAVSDAPPDWLFVMSSANAYTANPGQSAYAAASAFADAFALAIDAMPVRVLDWGFWGETGRVATAEYRDSLARIGVYPIATAEGLDLIGRALALPFPQLFALRVSDRVAESMGVLPGRMVRLTDARGPSIRAEIAAAGHAAAAARVGGQSAAEDFERVNAYGRARLGALLQPIVGEHPTADRLVERLRVVPRYRRLAVALADMLERATAPANAAALDRERASLLDTSPAAAPYLALLDRCVAALPEVLAGNIDANAVLFPDGSTALVEAIYRGNEVVDAYQQVLADAVRAAVQRRLADLPPGEAVRIVEIGAGTGGTTGFVLDALADLGRGVEYLVTDIGKGFVKQARQRFGAAHHYTRFAVLDIEADPAAQRFDAGGFDIAIAANVVHATRDIGRTLENTKTLLARGGLLFLNEAVAAQDFNTLTFGLTASWWLFEDAERRLPHAPLLDLAGWNRSLMEAGFAGCTAFGAEAGALQAIIMAESDGVLRIATAPAAPARSPIKADAHRARPKGNGDALRHIESVLRDKVAASLHLEPDEVEADVSFAEYGADSIISVDLVRQINEAFGIELKTTALFNYATIRELAGFIAVEFGDSLGLEDSSAEAAALAGDVAARVGEAKERSTRLREVIRRRLDRPAVNREQEFLEREGGGAKHGANGSAPAEPDPAGTELAAILAALECGEIGVEAALKVKIADA